ncbi:MAG: YraN family protein [Ignavibacteriaceae bacterium]
MSQVKSNKTVGDEGEEIAVEYLTSLGYEILQRNYRYSKGEIDIIAKDPDDSYTVFVEVKTRKNLEFGEPEYALTKAKIRQLKKIALAYQFDKQMDEMQCRIDVVAIFLQYKKPPVINHYKNCFYF